MVEVKLHDIGEGMTEGEIVHYLVKVGETVKVDQPLVEVSTDKMTAELPSPVAGIVEEILIETGTTINVGTTVLKIKAEGAAQIKEAPAEEADKTKKAEPATQKPAVSSETVSTKQRSKRVLASPYTRKIARENGIDIEQIQGTGAAGRVMDEDVYRFMENGPDSNVEETKAPALKETVEEVAPKIEATPEMIPFRGRRKQIAKKMTHSLFTIPHVTHFEEIDMTELMDYRKELKEIDVSISVAAFFLKALAIALKDFPVFNAKLDEENEQIKLEKVYNIGIATDSDEGLIVPVVHHVDKKSLKQIHAEIKTLTKKAQENKLTMDNLTGGTFTVSNVGPLGSIGATPIINHPETGLIAFHKTKKMPVVNANDEIVIRSMMNLSMSFDHRVADGATAVAFTNRFKQLIENPKLLMLELV
ncbi:dihydrolipoyllysine acetyltransferase [Lottiidibacillus patelloidae]|uniref:Dihydrolipoamide acetyltransferase component of pyruvate dehydrogenase complex n=1 Tax=Lottiidibacillus patelloidae TaxID=2670334 RepID=A0A263BXZ9_9BACI|nr:dihydrolipoamide acetyltransferase family protein [Lottiidibacillus patelloidae]OZM58187.1 dihydrolipoyllysine acetyltransferase [Lottiidibacillus patelloidae]